MIGVLLGIIIGLLVSLTIHMAAYNACCGEEEYEESEVLLPVEDVVL